MGIPFGANYDSGGDITSFEFDGYGGTPIMKLYNGGRTSVMNNLLVGSDTDDGVPGLDVVTGRVNSIRTTTSSTGNIAGMESYAPNCDSNSFGFHTGDTYVYLGVRTIAGGGAAFFQPSQSEMVIEGPGGSGYSNLTAGDITSNGSIS